MDTDYWTVVTVHVMGECSAKERRAKLSAELSARVPVDVVEGRANAETDADASKVRVEYRHKRRAREVLTNDETRRDEKAPQYE